MSLFTVPTTMMNILYGLFVIHHNLHRILRLNTTYDPTGQWVIQQLREAYPFDSVPTHRISDLDSILYLAAVEFVKALGSEPSRTACPESFASSSLSTSHTSMSV